jgi:hypothetical protein
MQQLRECEKCPVFVVANLTDCSAADSWLHTIVAETKNVDCGDEHERNRPENITSLVNAEATSRHNT